MNRFQLLASASLLTILTGPGAHSALAQEAEQAGTATTVVPSVEAALQGAPVRSIAIGNEIFRNERLSTGPDGHLHVLFLDESNLTLGPNSEVVVDRFVYDPSTSTGELAMRHASGVMRFVGGAISKTSTVEVETPVASLGIRGGIAVIRQLPDGSVQVFFVFGDSLSVEGAGGDSAVLDQAGFSVTIGPDGSIQPPEPIDPAELGTAVAALETPQGTQEDVSDAVVENLRDRLNEQPIDPETGLLLQDDAGGQPLTLDELEELLGTQDLDEDQVREVFEDIRRALEEQERERQRELERQMQEQEDQAPAPAPAPPPGPYT